MTEGSQFSVAESSKAAAKLVMARQRCRCRTGAGRLRRRWATEPPAVLGICTLFESRGTLGEEAEE